MLSTDLNSRIRRQIAAKGNKLHALIDVCQISIAMGSRKDLRTLTYSARDLQAIHEELTKDPLSASVINNKGETALHMAVSQTKPNLKIIRKLLDLNPLAAQYQNCNGNLPLHLLCLRSSPDVNLSIMKMLIAAFPQAVNVYNIGRETNSSDQLSVRPPSTPIITAATVGKPVAFNYMWNLVSRATQASIVADPGAMGAKRLRYNNTQLHLSIYYKEPLNKIWMYIQICPENVWARNANNRVPYDTACAQNASKVVKRVLLRSMFCQCSASALQRVQTASSRAVTKLGSWCESEGNVADRIERPAELKLARKTLGTADSVQSAWWAAFCRAFSHRPLLLNKRERIKMIAGESESS